MSATQARIEDGYRGAGIYYTGGRGEGGKYGYFKKEFLKAEFMFPDDKNGINEGILIRLYI